MRASTTRVAFIATTDSLGGGELLTLRVAEALQSSRFEPLIVGRPGSALLEAASDIGLGVRPLDLGPKLGLRSGIRVAAHFQRNRNRMMSWIAANLGEHDWLCLQYKLEELLWAGATVEPRVLIWEHGPVPAKLISVPPLRARLHRALSAADALLAWSDPASDSLARLGLSARRVDAGVDYGAVAEAVRRGPSIRAELVGRDEYKTVIVYAGRVTRDKGVLDLIAALPPLEQVLLLVVGDGPDIKASKAAAEAFGVSDRVRFVGFQSQPLGFIAASDVMILLSHSPGEGRPLSVLEANAVGTSVVGLRGNPAMEALNREGRVILTEGSAPALLARVIAEITSNPKPAPSVPSWVVAAESIASILN